MKQIEIGNKTLNVEVNGTCGLSFMVTKITGEEFDPENKEHLYTLIYVVLNTSNPDEDIKFEWLLSNITTKTFTELVNYTFNRWIEIEGVKITDKTNEKKKD